ncbi:MULTISPECIES: LCP family protein [Nocardiopsis]|uniref:Transcriptional regulator n=1 Tax=Nocardiopsis sinuspersici TaxID=501010 RepID=A0A1V3BXL2_9ACTN|nr:MULTISPECIES: LCP family protein [Nocardiopsis]OOC53195.1 transcriptional regulator [Nocardiopsis sinuspersici]
MSPGQWVACGMTGLLIAASLTVYAGYRDALSIATEEIDTDAWGDRPAQVEGIHNILLLGGDNESEGKRPDVLVIVNINVDNGTATMVNLPRDLIVDIPQCDPVGEFPGWPGGLQQINHAATYGGLDCLGNTVETTTDIHLDHMVMVDFAGFENIVDTIGGVELCISKPLDDPKAHLSLDPGTQTLNGEEALALARSRQSTEHKNDMGRIKSQQRLIGAILRKVTSGETLSSPTTLYDFLGSVTDSMVTDDGFTVDKMAELAIAMREVDLSRINMVMVPVVNSQTHQYKVDPKQPAADELFAAVASGDVLPEEESGDKGEDEESAEPAVEPGDVSVRVLNGTGRTGLADTFQGLLENQGFTVAGVGNPGPRNPEQSTIYHGPGQEAAAQTLAAALDTVRTEEVPDFGEELELVMAADWKGLAGDGSAPTGGGGEGALAELGATSAAEDTVSCE